MVNASVEGLAPVVVFVKIDRVSPARFSRYSLASQNAVALAYAVPDAVSDVIFSPQPYSQSHIQAVIKAIDAAQTSLDIAMYNLSDSNVEKALDRAIGLDPFCYREEWNKHHGTEKRYGKKEARWAPKLVAT